MQGLLQRPFGHRGSSGDDPALGVLPRPSPASQPTYGWPGASLVTQELSAGAGGAQGDVQYLGQEQMAVCALYFGGLRRARGPIKINVFNSTE